MTTIKTRKKILKAVYQVHYYLHLTTFCNYSKANCRAKSYAYWTSKLLQ